MSLRSLAATIVVLTWAMPATAQQRGTVEFGGFVSSTSFDNGLGMNQGWGGGGRIGVFIIPRLALEFEGGGSSAGRSGGLPNVNVGILSARLMAVPLRFGRLSVLVGAGVDHTDTYFIESYGVHGLLGASIALSRALALRFDGIGSHMANGKFDNLGLHVGLSVRRNPGGRGVPETGPVAAPPIPEKTAGVSASEERRLRDIAASYQVLRDSLAGFNGRPSAPVSSAQALATMHEMIYFPNDGADLSDSAKAILRDKIPVFRANPTMRIVIVGFASEPGTAAYNMALGLRRAEAARAYLVSRGVEPARIEIATRGQGELLVEGPGEAADAANRRGQFRLLIADPHLAPPAP